MMKHTTTDESHCPISEYITTPEADAIVNRLMSNETSDSEFQQLADRLQVNLNLDSNLEIISSLIVRRNNERLGAHSQSH